jgi:hypothetical protein
VSPFGPLIPPQPAVYSQPFDFVGPLFSHSYGLFVVPKKLKSFAIRQIRTLCAKYRGWGMSAGSSPYSASLRYRLASISYPFVFRILQIHFPATPFLSHLYKPPGGVGAISVRLFTSHSSRVTSHVLSFACRLFVVSLRSFPHSFPLFSRACSLFSQNAGVWHPPIPLEDARGGGYRGGS